MFTFDESSGIDLEYLAEGAANIVYTIHPRPTTPSTAADTGFYDYDPAATEIAPLKIDPNLEGKLMRLRKTSASNCSVLESYEHYKKRIVPILPREDRVDYTLFEIKLPILSELNQRLRIMESRRLRSKKRCGTYLIEGENHGLLITDMSCSSVSNMGYRCFEFKPKWLVQSPSAPVDAIRCRTCALRNYRRAQDHEVQSVNDYRGFCPLGLMSNSKETVERMLSKIYNWNPSQMETNAVDLALQQRLVDLVHDSPLLGRLRELQSLLDPHGVLLASVSDFDFLTAMTLRDCTMFIKIPIDSGGSTEARLGDLDFKSPSDGKGDYWRNLEESLVEQNWYTAKVKTQVDLDDFCLLEQDA